VWPSPNPTRPDSRRAAAAAPEQLSTVEEVATQQFVAGPV
jgi:hypothetical protein